MSKKTWLYARRGFWIFLLTSLLSIPLSFLMWVISRSAVKDPRLFIPILVFVIIAGFVISGWAATKAVRKYKR